MTLARLIRVGIVGAATRKNEVLAALQVAGFMHVDGLSEALAKANRAGSAGGERARQALRYLAGAPRVRAQVREDPAFNVEAFVDAVLNNRERRRLLHDAREDVDKRIARAEPWGAFSFPPSPDAIGGRLWFYEVPVRALEALAALKAPWSVAGVRSGTAYVVVVSQQEPVGAPGVRIHIGARSLASLRADRDALDLALDELALERETLTRRLGLLARDLSEAEDAGLLAMAGEVSAARDGVFVLQGWAAEGRLGEISRFSEAAGAAVWTARPGPHDRPPTLMAPAPALAAGADLARLYQLPGARDWDPSAALYLSFCGFFAIILSDAGYGLILLLATLALWSVGGRSAIGRRLRGLALAASGASVAWGVAVGSYFGAGPPHPLLARLHGVDLADYDTMMTVTVCIGAAHIAFANAAAAWAARGRRAMLDRLGWIVAIGAGLVAWLGPEAWRAAAFGGLALAGALVLVGANGVLAGLAALANVSKLFADILSYLRLFALGLASASLAVAFNDLAVAARDGAGAFGLVAFTLVLLFGHALNLALAVAGGVVHGLRLNLIEFFSWGLAEEGRPFVPFTKRSPAGRPSTEPT